MKDEKKPNRERRQVRDTRRQHRLNSEGRSEIMILVIPAQISQHYGLVCKAMLVQLLNEVHISANSQSINLCFLQSGMIYAQQDGFLQDLQIHIKPSISNPWFLLI